MNRDGARPRRPDPLGAMSGSPVWSADGRTIFFYSNRDGDFRIWAMNHLTERARGPSRRRTFTPCLRRSCPMAESRSRRRETTGSGSCPSPPTDRIFVPRAASGELPGTCGRSCRAHRLRGARDRAVARARSSTRGLASGPAVGPDCARGRGRTRAVLSRSGRRAARSSRADGSRRRSQGTCISS